MSTPIIVIKICEARQFENFGDYQDDRDGMWSVDIYAYKADPDTGECIEYLKDRSSSYNEHSGLWKSRKQAEYAALDKARPMVRVLRACRKKAYLINLNSDYMGDDLFLAEYLRKRQDKADRQARARTLREQAKSLIEQAKALA